MSRHPLCTQAVILVGGEGTRLRPITSRVPKPVAPVVERPFVSYVLDNLARHGVGASSSPAASWRRPSRPSVGDGRRYGLAVEYVVESEPLGTAGAIKNVRVASRRRPLLRPQRRRAQRRRPQRSGAPAHGEGRHGARSSSRRWRTRAATGWWSCAPTASVELLPREARQRARRRRRSSTPACTCSSREVLEMIPPDACSPSSAACSRSSRRPARCSATSDGGYWRDIGTPESYLQAHFDILEGAVDTAVADELGPSYLHVSPSARGGGHGARRAAVLRRRRRRGRRRRPRRAAGRDRRRGRGR